MFYALFLELSPEQTNLTLKITREGRHTILKEREQLSIIKMKFSNKVCHDTVTPSHRIALITLGLNMIFPRERIQIFLRYLTINGT